MAKSEKLANSAMQLVFEPGSRDDDRVHVACASGHFGEFLQGAFHDQEGAVRRGLVTVPCTELWSRGFGRFVNKSDDIIAPTLKTKAGRAMQFYLARYAPAPRRAVQVVLESNIPVEIGLGSSTTDIVATLRVLDRLFGRCTSDEEVAKIAVSSEGASDATMFDDRVVLFAQRDGTILEEYGSTWPSLEIIGLNLAPSERFSTDANPPCDYEPAEVTEFDALRQRLRVAIRQSDANGLAEIAMRSAEINQRYYPQQNFPHLVALAAAMDACGFIIAHTGTVAGLLFRSCQTINDDGVKEIADRAAAFGASYHLRFAVGFHSIASEKPPAFGDQINA